MADSWTLKLYRAERHLEDFDRMVALYLEKHAYRATRTVEPKCEKHRDCWRFHLEMTERPDDYLAIVMGDVVHNLRSALDHIAVAIAPPGRKRSALFPIISEQVEWASSDAPTPQQFIARESFDRAVEGMPAEAVAIIQRAQPYHLGPQRTRETHLLEVLSRLDNADKHRELIVLAPGVMNATANVAVRRISFAQGGPPGTVVENGAQVLHFTTENHWPPIRESEIYVQIHGTQQVTVEVGLGADESFPPEGIRELIGLLREFFITLDPYVRRPTL
jgi:hypothetical protein